MFEFEKKKLYNHIGNELLEHLLGHPAYVAGGTITSLFCNREINDLDIYFKTEKAFVEFVTEIWGHGTIVAATNKATLITKSGKDIQLIHFRYFETAQDIFNTFDFTACMGAFDFETQEFFLHPEFMQHNSQRMLKFNSHTAFPIVSLLRVQKYKEKGYKISKPEFIRIALACMNLKINTYEELKEQMGGMYGINYDKLFEDMEGELDLQKAIDKIANLALDEDYFKMPAQRFVEMRDSELEEYLQGVTKMNIPYVEINNRTYWIFGGVMKKMRKPKNGEQIDANEFIKNKKFYKFVKKCEDKYFSFYDKTYEYKIGEYAIPKTNSYYSNNVLYFNEMKELSQSTYKNEDEKVLLEVSCNVEDFNHKDSGTVMLKKCFVIREVPVEEYQKYLEYEVEEPF